MSKVAFKLNGKSVSRDEFLATAPPKKNWFSEPPVVSNTYSEHDPLINQGGGVMKSQVQEGRDLIRKHNIQGVQVRNDGSMRYTSQRGRKEWHNRRGMHDLDGGFSD